VVGLRMLTRLFAAALVCAAAGAGVAQAATTRYVATAANGGSNTNNTCASSAAPCLTIGHAAAEAASGDAIHIGPGHFKESVSATTKALTLIGAGPGNATTYNPSTQTMIDASSTTGPAVTAGNHNVTLENLRLEGGAGGGPTIEPAVLVGGGSSTPVADIGNCVLLQAAPSNAVAALPAVSADGSGDVSIALVRSLVIGAVTGVADDSATGSLSIVGSSISVPTPQLPSLETPMAVSSRAPSTAITGSLLIGSIGFNDDGLHATILRTAVRASRTGVIEADHGDGPTLAIRDSVVAPDTGTMSIAVEVGPPPSHELMVPSINLTFASVLARFPGSAYALDVLQAGVGTHVTTMNTILRSIDSSGGSGNDDIITGSQALNWSLGYTDYQQASGPGVPPVGSGTNFDVAPHFVDDTGTNLRLAPSSTLFDKGNPAAVLSGETDIVGAPRALAHVCGVAPLPDVGAFEAAAPGSCPPPTAALTTPANGATYTQGQSVTASYTCGTPPAPATLSACTGTVANGSKLDTSALGTFTFTVAATANDGATATATATYTVKPAPPPKPSVGSIKASHKTFADGNKLATIAKKHKQPKPPPIGTTFTFKLNTAATLKLSFAQQLKGRKVKRKCVAQTKHNQHDRSCKLSKSDGTITLNGRPGTDKISFQGRVSKHKKLGAGTYTLTITATNSSGKSRGRSVTFTIAKR
jgi:hypothetical protein